MKKVLIIGATSKIAHEAAREFAKNKAELFLIARNDEKLASVAADLEVRGAKISGTIASDLIDTTKHQQMVDQAISSLGQVDAVLIAQGMLSDQLRDENDFETQELHLKVNFLSVVSFVSRLATYFETQQAGTLAVISSVAGVRGRRSLYIYGAAKAGVNHYLDGIRQRLAPQGICVVDIRPGPVDTPMTKGMKKGALTAKASDVGVGIYTAMKQGKSVVYLPWFWRWIMLIIRLIPEPIFVKLNL